MASLTKALVPTMRFLLKACHAPGEAIDEGVEFRIGNGAVDVAVAFGEFAGEVIGADQDFERPAAADLLLQLLRIASSLHCDPGDGAVDVSQIVGRPFSSTSCGRCWRSLTLGGFR